jgi:hypothetical protein
LHCQDRRDEQARGHCEPAHAGHGNRMNFARARCIGEPD